VLQREFFKRWLVQGGCYLACPKAMPSARTDIVKRLVPCSVLVVLHWKSWGREAKYCLAWSFDERSKSLETGHWLQRKSLTVCPVTRTLREVLSPCPVTRTQSKVLSLCPVKIRYDEAMSFCSIKLQYGEAMPLCTLETKIRGSSVALFHTVQTSIISNQPSIKHYLRK